MIFLRLALFAAVFAAAVISAQADEILFVGNSFTIGSAAPSVLHHGGVPKLVEEIAASKGRHLLIGSVAVGGKSWSYHLSQPETAAALAAKKWTWVVLQDMSTRPTHIGDVKQFMLDGETFSTRIAQNSPHAGILLFETWARPPGSFYSNKATGGLTGPEQMTAELHDNYGLLRDDLAAKNPDRPVRVALVGTAFARLMSLYPAINLLASDRHHANAEGYYLAALVLYETIYHDSVKGATTRFFQGELTIPDDDAAKLQAVADEVAGGAK